ncbi:MAG: hypothetical protein ACREOI_36915, partial [bacterium]
KGCTIVTIKFSNALFPKKPLRFSLRFCIFQIEPKLANHQAMPAGGARWARGGGIASQIFKQFLLAPREDSVDEIMPYGRKL